MLAAERYDSLFRYYAARYSLEWAALKAQAMAESNLDPFARSPAGAVGLMQFMAPTWAEWWVRCHPGKTLASRSDAERSIELGAAYMAHLVELFGALDCAWAAYNWGMGNLRRHLEQHGGQLAPKSLPAETSAYILRIDRFRDLLLRGG